MWAVYRTDKDGSNPKIVWHNESKEKCESVSEQFVINAEAVFCSDYNYSVIEFEMTREKNE